MPKKKRIGVPLNAVHPGEILREEFMAALSLTSYRLAKDLNLPLPRVNDIVREKRDHRRYGPAPGTVLRHFAADMDESADEL